MDSVTASDSLGVASFSKLNALLMAIRLVLAMDGMSLPNNRVGKLTPPSVAPMRLQVPCSLYLQMIPN